MQEGRLKLVNITEKLQGSSCGCSTKLVLKIVQFLKIVHVNQEDVMCLENLIVKTKNTFYYESGYLPRLKDCFFLDSKRRGVNPLFPIISPACSGKNGVVEQFLGFTIFFCYVIYLILSRVNEKWCGVNSKKAKDKALITS